VDTNHDYKVETKYVNPLKGIPIVGDFDGDGKDDLATWKDDAFCFDLASNGFGQLDATVSFGFIGVREKPVAADMDRDGIDDIGLWVPDRAGVAPEENGEWYLLISNAFGQNKASHFGSVYYLNHAFTPVPFGKDMYASFGDEYAVPVLGNFDPPVTPVSSNPAPIGVTNLDNRFDVSGDGSVDALDVLILINDINARGQREISLGQLAGPFLDVTLDGVVSPGDVLGVINYVNNALVGGSSGGGEGESFLANEWVPDGVVTSVAVPAESVPDFQYAALLAEPAPSAGAVGSAVATVDQYFATAEGDADDLAVYAGELADVVEAGSGPGVRRTLGDGVADLALDGVLADLAADQDQSQETSADGVFARLGRFFRRLA
jgi:hypothetical protein